MITKNRSQCTCRGLLCCRLVLAFEVELSEVCGLDYMWRLCEDGRLVVEARLVVKREFVTVSLAQTAGGSF